MAGKRKQRAGKAAGGKQDRARQPAPLDPDLARYRAVIETSADGFLTADAEGRILEVNEAYVRRSGYSRAELLSMHLSQLEAQEAPTETAAHIQKIITEGSDLFETLHRSKDGTVWQAEVNVSYWPIEGGRFFSFIRDVAGRKRSEALLRTRLQLSKIAESGTIDDLLRCALDAAELQTGSSIGFFHFVADDQETLTLQAWSTNTLARMCTAAGKGRHYPISQAGVWVDCVPARTPVIHNDYASLPHRKGTPAGHAPVTREVVVPVVREGKIVAIAGIGNKTTDYVQGDVEVLQEIASGTMEIVARRQAEERLRRSEASLKKAAALGTMGYWEWDIASNALLWSDEVFRIYGMNPQTARPSYEIVVQTVAPECRERFVKAVEDAVRLGAPFDGAYRVLALDGRERFTHTTGEVVRDGEGQPVSMFGIVQDVTERKRAEQQLHESEERFQLAMRGANDGLWDWDLTTDAVYYSPRWKSMLGYAPEELEPTLETWKRLVHPEDRARTLALVQDLLDGRADKFEVEFRMRHKDGSWRHVLSRAFFSGGGSRRRLVGTHVDITERKAAELALRESERLFRDAIEFMPIPIGIANADGSLRHVNKAFTETFAYTIGDIPTIEAWSRAAYPDAAYRESTMRQWERDVEAALAAGGSTPSREYRVRCKHGGEKRVEITMQPIGGLFIATFQDVTDKRRAELALAESEEKYRAIVESSRDLIWSCDVRGVLTYSNNAVRAVLGYAPEEVVGRATTDMLHPDDVAETGRWIERAVESRSGWRDLTLRCRHKDGTYRTLESSASPVFDPAGALVGWLGVDRDVTERQQAEKTLRESESRFKVIFENAADAIFIADAETGAIVDANEAAARLIRMPREQIVGLHHAKLHPPASEGYTRETFEEHLLAAERVLPLRPIEHAVLRSDGVEVPVEVLAARITIAGRSCLMGVFRDVTERKQREARLERDRRLLEFIAATQLDFIKQKSARDVFGKLLGDLLVLTDSAYGFIGEVLADEAGRPYLKTHALTNVAWSEETRRFYAEHERQGFEFRNLATLFGAVMTTGKAVIANDPRHDPRRGGLPAGHPELNSFLGMPLSLEGRVVGMFGIANRPGGYLEGHLDYLAPFATVCANIIEAYRIEQERTRAEGRVAQSEQFIRGILDSVDEGFIVVDRDYRILTVNKAYCEQVGAASDGVTGRHCYEVSHRSPRPCHEEGEECAVRRVFETGRAHAALHRHPDAEGQLLYVETRAYPLFDAAGHVTSAIETITNITERKLLEEERLKTQKLESIGTLAGGIAHDFNNLLQGVFGYISMAKMPLDRGDRSYAMLEQAEKALHLSVNLTSQLLTFSKGGKPVRKPVALGPVVESAVRFALSGSRSVARIELAPGLWEADADAGQIAQVIQNIALNADQAMPLGGTVTVAVRNLGAAEAATRPALGARDYIAISVRDEGVGIPATYLDKIFDPYFTTKEKGSGLGLATSYSIVKNHEGRIEVQSVPGAGSTFTVYLPATATAPAAPAAQPMAPAAVRAGRILVMDDEEIVRAIAGELLAALGHEVDFAERGEEALEKYRAAAAAGRPYDAVILDLTIRGGMGGAQTVRGLLGIDPGVKAVVSSGYSDDDVTASFREHGFRAFLKKPYRLEELKRILDELLG